MLAALEDHVRNFIMAQMQSSGTFPRSWWDKGGKRTRPHSKDLLQAALLESGYSPSFFEGADMAELLETVKVKFLGTWGVPPVLDSLLAKHERRHRELLAPWRKQT